MNTNLRALSLTLRELLGAELRADLNLRDFFDPARGGPMSVSLLTPEELSTSLQEGLSLWLYRIERDENTLNQPPRRVARDRLLHQPLPLKVHYLLTPIVNNSEERSDGPELEQNILGVALQTLHDHAILRGADLRGDLAGSGLELHTRIENLDVEQISRVWEALEGSYQLCVSYEVSVVPIDSARQAAATAPVDVLLPEPGVSALEGGAP